MSQAKNPNIDVRLTNQLNTSSAVESSVNNPNNPNKAQIAIEGYGIPFLEVQQRNFGAMFCLESANNVRVGKYIIALAALKIEINMTALIIPNKKKKGLYYN